MKVLKASGWLYKENEKIGLSNIMIKKDAIDRIIESSKKKYPVLKDYKFHPDGLDIYGYATLEHKDGGIYATVFFNENGINEFESTLNDVTNRRYFKLGFMIRHNRCFKRYLSDSFNDLYYITDGDIICITIKTDNLGGQIEEIWWEDM